MSVVCVDRVAVELLFVFVGGVEVLVALLPVCPGGVGVAVELPYVCVDSVVETGLAKFAFG